MKMMKRLFAILLIVFLLCPFCLNALADGEKEASIVPDDSFESVFMEYKHDDGSVTTTYRDGSVSTQYADGSFEGVDGNGNRHTKDKDGTYTVYATDGSIAVERPDGTQELTEKNGRKTVVNPDGSGKTVFANGLVIEHDADYNQTATYFDGGKEKLKADKNGEFPEGEIRGKNGEILKNTENGLYLKGANGVEYELDTDKDTSSITFPDGGTAKTEGENGEIRFADGAVFTMTGGQSKFTGADGSFVYIDKNSDAWEIFNADDGTHVKVDEAGEISDMYQENNGNVLKIENGQITEWKDAEAGITITCDENGTTVKTPEGTYFTDGKGNITKDGKPLKKEEDEDDPSQKKPAPELSDKYDDSYCLRSFDGDKLWMSTLSSNDFYGRKYDSENGLYYYDWVHQIWDEDHKQLYVQEKYDMTVSMKHISEHRGEWLDSMGYSISVADYSTDFLETQYKNVDDIPTYDGASRMNIQVDGYDAVYIYTEGETDGDGNGIMPNAKNSGTIYVPIVDSPNQNGEINTLVIRCILHGESHELFDSMKDEYLNLIKNLPCKITVKKDSQEFKKMKDAYEEEEEEDSGVIPYHGRLTYTNGGKNKYGQPWPDLMDFDGDGDIDYADRQIQHVLVHNPDALDTPEGFALVMTALIAALAGAGGGSAFGVLSGSLGSGASGMNFDFDFSGEGEESEENEGASDAASDERGQEPEQAPEEQKEDLGPYISRDADGDLNVKDPATGEERLYVANGDGTYTNPLTGATYTEDELKDSLESRAENADLIRQDNAAAKEAIDAQREENQGKSWIAEEAEAENAAQRAKEAAEADQNKYKEKLADKYGVYSGDDDLYKRIGEKQGQAEVEFYEHMAEEEELHGKQQYVETVEKAADTSIDVLADVTGRKDIKAGYTMLKNTAARTTEAVVNDKNVLVGMAQGAIEGGISVVQDNVDGAANKLVANVVGETYKEAMDATINGKDMTEAVVGGIGNGLLNTGVDVGMDLVGDGVKEMMGDVADEAIKNTLTEGAEVTKGSIVDGVKTLTGDLIKGGIEEATKMPGDDD